MVFSVVTSILSGFTAGMLHVVSGPDHIAALAPLSVRNRLRAVRTGAVWGAGHGCGVLILGSVGIFAKEYIDIHWISERSEMFIGVMLVCIGLWAMRQTVQLHKSGFAITMRNASELDAYESETGRESSGKNKMFKMVDAEAAATASTTHTAAFSVGVLHGAAGTGHLFGVLPSLALPAAEAAAYLVSYLVAAIMAMAGVGCILGSIGDYGGPRAILGLMGGSSVVAIGVGLLWIFLPEH